jgi:hypothetical protein
MRRAWCLVPLRIAMLKDGSHLQLKGYLRCRYVARTRQRPLRREYLDPKRGFLELGHPPKIGRRHGRFSLFVVPDVVPSCCAG